jgi:hypothetical protein
MPKTGHSHDNLTEPERVEIRRQASQTVTKIAAIALGKGKNFGDRQRGTICDLIADQIAEFVSNERDRKGELEDAD